jgi:hypothetical protein
MADCSCRGLNPDCFRCEGTGIIVNKNQRNTDKSRQKSTPGSKTDSSKSEPYYLSHPQYANMLKLPGDKEESPKTKPLKQQVEPPEAKPLKLTRGMTTYVNRFNMVIDLLKISFDSLEEQEQFFKHFSHKLEIEGTEFLSKLLDNRFLTKQQLFRVLKK